MNNIERADHKAIVKMVESKARVLDLGCGHGELLYILVKYKEIKGQGIEIDEQCIYDCVAKGLSVCHGDIDSGLSEYNDNSFDYVILNQTFQQVKHPDLVLNEALRVGNKVIVGFPNFVYYRARYQLCFKGRVPVFSALPYTWYSTPNLHFFGIWDFVDYCRQGRIKIEKSVYISGNIRIRLFPNMFAQMAIFQVSK